MGRPHRCSMRPKTSRVHTRSHTHARTRKHTRTHTPARSHPHPHAHGNGPAVELTVFSSDSCPYCCGGPKPPSAFAVAGGARDGFGLGLPLPAPARVVRV
jgi:hypothetical protein